MCAWFCVRLSLLANVTTILRNCSCRIAAYVLLRSLPFKCSDTFVAAATRRESAEMQGFRLASRSAALKLYVSGMLRADTFSECCACSREWFDVYIGVVAVYVQLYVCWQWDVCPFGMENGGSVNCARQTRECSETLG